jgi:hypothetical protein
LDDVLSDMSRFHRVDDINDLTVDVFVSRMVRLPVYGGAVAFSISNETPPPAAGAGVAEPAQDSTVPGTVEYLQTNPMFGPLPAAGQMVGLFETSTVPAT